MTSSLYGKCAENVFAFVMIWKLLLSKEDNKFCKDESCIFGEVLNIENKLN